MGVAPSQHEMSSAPPPSAEALRLDYLITAARIRSMTREHRSVGVRWPEITAVSADPDGLDDLVGGSLVGYPIDPMAADPDDLMGLNPAFKMAGGLVRFDADGRLQP